MTTIAYRNGELAADQRGTAAGWITTNSATKVFKSDDGRLIAMFGDPAVMYPYVLWLMRDEDKRCMSSKPALSKDAGAVIEVGTDGCILVHSEGGYYPARGEFLAWGSGFPAALAAMHMGASARRAVEIAGLIDESSGGPVDVVSLNDAKVTLLTRDKIPA